MLAGFLLVAAAQLALVVVPVLLVLSLLPDAAALRLGVPLCTATVGVMAYATWRALRGRRNSRVGIPVGRADAPGLWTMLDDAAAVAGVAAPDSATVIAEAVVTLTERSRLLGLIGGRRDLYLGLPLLQAWDTARLRAAVAHELAHGSPRLGRLAPLAYRGRVAVGRAVSRLPHNNPAGPLLRWYAELYHRVDAPFSRAQELGADRIAAEFAGGDAAAAVLRDRPALEALLRVFHAEYVGPGWRAGHVPSDLFGGFLRVLAARADEMALLRARDLPAPAHWDTHPPLADRLAALSPASEAGIAAPAVLGLSGDAGAAPTAEATLGRASDADITAAAGPASSLVEPTGAAKIITPRRKPGPPTTPKPTGEDGELVPDLPGLARALQAVAFPPHGRTTVGWDAFFGAARTSEMEREADGALGAISRAAGTPVSNAADVLDLAADGRLRKAAEAIFPDLPPDDTAGRIGELVTLLLALAALRSGVARWRHSWTGTAELVTPDGGHFDLGGLAALAGDPATVATARDRLTALGVDLAGTGGAGDGATRAEVVSGLVNLVVDGSRTDLLIVDTGLLLVPGLPRSQNGSAKRRLAQFAAADLPQRDEAAPGSRFVPYADLAGATQTRRTPKSWDFRLRDGGTLTLRTALDSDELPGGWAALDHAVAFLARTR
jgi:Zn-dependent protease with chaperone function